MFVKHFREVNYRVPDPMRPGHSVFDRRLDSAGTHTIVVDGKSYTADDDGWFDVPEEIGQDRLKFPGWCTPEMVDEEVVAGRIRADASDLLPSTREKLESKQGGAPKSSKPRSSRKQKGTAVAAHKDV